MMKIRSYFKDIDSHKLFNLPYSVEKIKDYFQYEIATYGYEHLFPEVLQYELKIGLLKFLQEIDEKPRGQELFEFSLENLNILKEINEKYHKNNILEFCYRIEDDTIKIFNIHPLKKLDKSRNPLETSIAILDACFTGFQINYKKNHLVKSRTKIDFLVLDPSIIKNIPILHQYVLDYIVIPTYHLHFISIENAVLYFLQYINPSNKISYKPIVYSQGISFFKILRGLNLKEHYFLNIRSCEYCRKLLNPLSNKYSTFCQNPFLCDLKKGFIKGSGWSIIGNKVYIWTNTEEMKKLLKNNILLWIENSTLKNRQQSYNCSNQIYRKESFIGSIYNSKDVFIVEFFNYRDLIF